MRVNRESTKERTLRTHFPASRCTGYDGPGRFGRMFPPYARAGVMGRILGERCGMYASVSSGKWKALERAPGAQLTVSDAFDAT
jgi:hypothetical protein